MQHDFPDRLTASVTTKFLERGEKGSVAATENRISDKGKA